MFCFLSCLHRPYVGLAGELLGAHRVTRTPGIVELSAAASNAALRVRHGRQLYIATEIQHSPMKKSTTAPSPVEQARHSAFYAISVG